MKKNLMILTMLISSFSILFGGILFSCSAPGASSNSGSSKGNLAISINEAVSASEAPAVGGPDENILPPISMDPASYHIAGTGPGGATFEETITGTSVVVDSLAFGEWTLTVTALNADGTSIGVGSSVAIVHSNATAMANVTVRPHDGVGTLDLSLAWTAGDVNTPQVVSTLQPNAGLTRTLDFTVAGASASFSAADVPTGYHTLVLKLLDNGILTMGAVDVVRIVADNTTSGSSLFDKINKATGTIEVGITPEMGDPLTVEIAGGAETKPENQSMSLTASVTNYANNVNYVWYVNGDSVETGATFDFDDSWVQGYYRIDVTAYNVDGSRAGSDSVFVEIVEAETIVFEPVKQVTEGSGHSMILTIDGSLWATGLNNSGQLGNGTTIDSHVPVQIMSSGVQAVSAGTCFTMIIKTDGSLWATGRNTSGQLGNGTTTDSHVPVQIVSSGVQAVSCGVSFTMILKNDGSLWATGENRYGQFGNGTNINSNIPVEIMSSDVQAVSAGGEFTMILKTDGSLWATGNNRYGQLGNGTTINTNVPVEIVSNGVKSVSAGIHHTMILRIDDSLWAAGRNGSWQLGTGSTLESHIPVQILSSGVQAVSAGVDHSMILKSDGSLWGTGSNSYGQLGNGGVGTYLRVPVEIISNDVQAVSCRTISTFIIKRDGSLWATGYNFWGILGNGTTTNSNIPVQIVF